MKTIHLLSDEQLVVQWLSQYGPMPIELVRAWLSYKPQNIQDKILKNLLIHGFVYQVAGNILTIDPTAVTPNKDIVLAGWVLSQLDGIEGLGPKRKQLLMKHFKSFKNLKAASLEDIKAAKVIPEEVAEELVRVLAQYNERKEEKEEQLADSVLANTIP